MVGPIAYSCCIQSGYFTAKDGSRLVAVRVTDVLRKVKGKWLIVQEQVFVLVDLGAKRICCRNPDGKCPRTSRKFASQEFAIARQVRVRGHARSDNRNPGDPSRAIRRLEPNPPVPLGRF